MSEKTAPRGLPRNGAAGGLANRAIHPAGRVHPPRCARCHAHVADVPQTQLLATFLPEAAKPRVERTVTEQATVTSWHQKVAWFLALHHVGRQPSFN